MHLSKSLFHLFVRKSIKNDVLQNAAFLISIVAAATLFSAQVFAASDDIAIPPLPAALSGTPGQTILLNLKEQYPLPSTGKLRRIAISDPDIVDALTIDGKALLVAKKAGVALVTIWNRGTTNPIRYTVQVRSSLSSSILDQDSPNVTVQGNTALISGSAASLIAHNKAVQVANESATNVIDTSTVNPGGVVQVDVKIVEFTKSVLKSAGFNIFTNRANGFGFGIFSPSSLTNLTTTPSGGGSSGAFTPAITPQASAFNLLAGPIGNGLFANLNLLQTNGLARILAEPTLVALSGQSASFLAGGELPIPQAGGLGTTTVIYKSFGVGLTLTPTVLTPNRIALKVAPEASDLDYGTTVTLGGITVPSITTRRADTTVELGDGESFIIGGLVSRNTASSVSKVPFLGDLPIIGTFFRSLNFKQNEKELVIIVTPHIVHPIAKGATLALPGQREEQVRGPVWGSFVLGPWVGKSELPGFSR